MQKAIISIRPLISAALISTMLGGCAGTTVSETDPWEGWNRQVLGFNDEFDTVVINPLSTAYSSVVPEFVNDGLGNFFSNINDIGVTVNDLLQLKIEQGGMDASRFLVNTTTGLFGFIDVAKMMGLPKHNEDFGQTLGFWGVPSGDYLVVPFLGASSPRELVGVIGDALMNPLTYSFVFAGSGTLFRALSAANSPRQVAGVLGTAVGTAVMDPLTYPFAVFGSGPVVSNALDPEPHLVRFNDADAAAPKKATDTPPLDRYDYVKSAYQEQRKYLVHDGMVSDENTVQLAEEDTDDLDMGLNYKPIRKRYRHMFISP